MQEVVLNEHQQNIVHFVFHSKYKFKRLFLNRRYGKTRILLYLAQYYNQLGQSVHVVTTCARTMEQFLPFHTQNGPFDICLIDDIEHVDPLRIPHNAQYFIGTTSINDEFAA